MTEDLFRNPVELEADLLLQESILKSRSQLVGMIVAASQDRSDDVLETLRIESMYQFAEFFYLLKARRIHSIEQVEVLAQIHNRHLDHLCRDAEKMRRLGLKKDRVLDAIFTSDTLPRLLEYWRESPGQIDQSNLARFLVTVMSNETCRKLVVASGAAGFLRRRRSVHGTVLVQSTGVLEQLFGRALRELRHQLLASHSAQ